MGNHYVPTSIRFKCPECGAQANVQADVPEVDYSFDRLSDSLSEDDIDLECPHCRTFFGAHVQNSPSHCAVELIEHPGVEVYADDAFFPAQVDNDEEGWLNQDVPEQPFHIFMGAYHRLGDILGEYGEGAGSTLPHSAQYINRMVFATTVAAMEAFLGDLLTNAVMSEEVALTRLLTKDKELKDAKVPLSEILANPNVVAERARTYLGNLLYHNLAKIAVLYNLVLDVEILPDAKQKERLMRAMEIRHDIVHRNGKDKDGTEVILSTSNVVEILEDMREFLENIDNKVKASLQKLANTK